MEQQDDFNEWNRRIELAMSNLWDGLLDECSELAERHGLDHERTIRIGAWDRVKKLERIEGGDSYLSDEDLRMLMEEGKFFDKGKTVFRDGIATTLTAAEISAMKEWHAASYDERTIAFVIYSWALVSSGMAEPEECVYLFGMANSLISYIGLPKGQEFDFSALGKKGANKRHGPMQSLREWAVEKYRAGKWQSANQAAYELKESVIAHGRTIGATLTNENAQRTIADWFRKSV